MREGRLRSTRWVRRGLTFSKELLRHEDVAHRLGHLGAVSVDDEAVREQLLVRRARPHNAHVRQQRRLEPPSMPEKHATAADAHANGPSRARADDGDVGAAASAMMVMMM
eukprot:5292672-Pleurochrysis_carterae.AAC.1